MAEHITVTVDIKPHLKKYLLKVYGPEPIQFPRGNGYNTLLVRMLSKPPDGYKPEPHQATATTIELVLPFNKLKNVRVYNHLSQRDMIDLRKQFDNDFMDDYHMAIKEATRNLNITRKQATILCMQNYNITDDDLTFDAFYKNFWRKLSNRAACICLTMF